MNTIDQLAGKLLFLEPGKKRVEAKEHESDMFNLAWFLVSECYGRDMDDDESKVADKIIERLGFPGGVSEDTYYEMQRKIHPEYYQDEEDENK